MDNLERAQRWIAGAVRDRQISAYTAAAGYLFIAALGMGAWFGIVWGFAAMFFILIAGLGINPFILPPIVYAAQFVVFPFVRRPRTPRWEVGQDVDGEVVVIPPDNSRAGDYIYNQDHGFSFKRVYFALFFAAPIALDEAWRETREAARIRKLNAEPAAQLAALLIEEQRKLTFEELRKRWTGDWFNYAIAIASEVNGFQLFANDPQGVALTDTAIDELLQQ